jgi:hypothetical protein
MLPQLMPLLIPYVTKALRDLADDLDREYGKAK